MLVECAWSTVKMKDTPLSNFYKKIKVKKCSKKAVIAVARKILVIIYHLLKNRTEYDVKKFEKSIKKQKKSRLNHLVCEAKKFGYSLVPIEDIP
jgi:hypothetical protein